MLSLEALFTALLAWRLYGDTLDRRTWGAVLLLLAGGVTLVLDQSQGGSTQLWGLVAVTAATVAWGVDNTLSRPLADKDPGQVVSAKALLGTFATISLAALSREPVPGAMVVVGLLAVGASGYGLSLRFYLLAQRTFGAARTGSVFAFAPLEMLHEHAHSHDDGHHEHTHDPMPMGPHSHAHRHPATKHSHAHVPDLHHTHRH